MKNIYNKISKIIAPNSNLLKKNGVLDFDNADIKEEMFKKNVFFIAVFVFFIMGSLTTYIFIKGKVLEFQNKDKERPPLKIVIPYPNSVINIDDYEILKYQIKPGDTLSNILNDNIGISSTDTINIMKALRKVYNPAQLKVGQIIDIKYKTLITQDDEGNINEAIRVEEISIETTDKEKEIVVSLNKQNEYIATENKISLNKHYMKYKVKITESLYNDGFHAGISPAIMLDFIKFFSFDIDFQRDLQKGDTFEILFEIYSTDDGKKVKDGDILYASINNLGRNLEIYKYNINGINNYFNKTGQSVQKSLLRTPINGARISSQYGLRRHPILGYTKLHTGKDFAAPTGTPIFAAGSGTIAIAKYWSTWGNYVRIKHAEGYETEYAHANKIASGIKPGVRVRQGQVIAYVGSTGRSTGPHLHYGVIYKGKKINPDRVKSLPSVKLMGKDLINFNKEVQKIDLYRLNIPNQNLILKR